MSWNPRDELRPEQRAQLNAYAKLLIETNQKVNLISRASADDLEHRHLIHSLALTRTRLPAGSRVVDFGTGGGLPGIPLAIAFPDVHFVLVDSIAKKIRAVEEMAGRLGLTNTSVWNGRAETWPGKAHYAVSRATAPLVDLWHWFAQCRIPLEVKADEAHWPQGLICLKGGDLSEETQRLIKKYPRTRCSRTDLLPLLGEGFEEKYIILVE